MFPKCCLLCFCMFCIVLPHFNKWLFCFLLHVVSFVFFCALLIWQLYMCKFSWADLGKTNQELKATDSNPKWAGPCQTCVKWRGLGKVWTSWNHTVAFPAFDSFFGQDLNKVAMGIYRPCSGIFVRLSQRVVQENSQLMGSFTSQRPIRRSADLARPIWSAKTTCPSGSALLSLSTVRSFELYMFIVVALLHMSALFCSASLISRLFNISWDLGGKHEIYLSPENLFPLLAFLRLNIFETLQDSLEYVCLSAASLRVKMFRSRRDQR